MKGRCLQKLEMHIGREGVAPDRIRYRAELWHRPFSGWMLASTRWVSTKQWARRDGNRVFGAVVKETACGK